MLWLAVNVFDTLLICIFWALASSLTKGLASRWNEGKLRFRAGLSLGVIGFSILLFVFQIIVWIRLGAADWLFIEDKVLIQLPLILFPVISVLLFTVPRLLDIRKQSRSRSKEPVPNELISSLSNAKFIVPMKAVALGALANFLLTILAPQSPVEFTNLFLVWLVYVVIVIGLWIRTGQKQKVVSSERTHGRLRLLKSLGKMVAVFSIIAFWYVYSMQSSRLPDVLNMMEGKMVYGGGASVMHPMVNGHTGHSGMENAVKTVSVTELTGPQTDTPDRRFTITAEKKEIVLSSGKRVEAWTFNGLLPGPELRIRQGELVEITLINRDIDDGVTLHWHGLDVPNAEDGVAGLTQDAVMPGDTYTYRFRAEQVGTFWYHSHQSSSEQVSKGLFGVLIVEPRENTGLLATKAATDTLDIAVARHSWNTVEGSATAFGSADTLQHVKAAPGTSVRLRLLNADDWPKNFYLTGVKYKVAAIDGTELNEPEEMENRPMLLAAGGRYDVTFTMPDSPVVLTNRLGAIADAAGPALLLSPDGVGSAPESMDGQAFEPWNYGSGKTTPFGPDSRFDREFVMVLDNKAGFYDGKFDFLFTINGKVFPNTPMFMVREGELIKTKFVNRSVLDHPMHLHGHHMLVLSRNGKSLTGSPWWTDTLNVPPGETYEVAFRADNPGIWMDHCHNLEHAAVGMTMHLAYEGVTSPFEVGHATINHPE